MRKLEKDVLQRYPKRIKCDLMFHFVFLLYLLCVRVKCSSYDFSFSHPLRKDFAIFVHLHNTEIRRSRAVNDTPCGLCCFYSEMLIYSAFCREKRKIKLSMPYIIIWIFVAYARFFCFFAVVVFVVFVNRILTYTRWIMIETSIIALAHIYTT